MSELTRAEAAMLAAVEAAWKDNQRRITYPTDQPFSALPELTQTLWLASTTASVIGYLQTRLAQEATPGPATFIHSALRLELEAITAIADRSDA